ncbi:MAG TPA: PAS domain S-box protein, partial [Gemmataceae bacterium]|nr:PAS domain S-box protein [Gemmataceae bacterium]
MVIFDIETGQVLDANPAALRMTGRALAGPVASLFGEGSAPPEPPPLGELKTHGVAYLLGPIGPMPVRWTCCRLYGPECSVALLTLRAGDYSQDPRENRRGFQTFMDNCPLVGFITDHDGRLVYANATAALKCGQPIEHLLGKTAFDLFPPEIAKKLREDELQVLASRRPLEVREFAPTADGVLREWWVARFPMHDPNGQILIGTIAIDLTDTATVENALRRSEERYRQLWHRNLAGSVRATLDGRILDCNDSFSRLFGYESREDMLTRSTRELYYDPGARDEFIARLRENQFLTNYELRMRRADGAPVWILENVGLINENGQEILEATLIDITDRKRTEEALRASEATYRTLIDNLDQSIFLKDRDLRYVTVNPVFCAGVGKSEDQLRGKTIGEAFPASAVAEKSKMIERMVLEDGRPIESEEVMQSGGKPRNIRVHRTPVRATDGSIVGVLGICWDVTNQRALETQLRHVQKMDAVGQLAGGIAHDFNNLLTIMLGNLSFILSGEHDLRTTLELVKNVEEAGLRAAQLTQTLLGFSRRAALATAPCNLNHAIEEVVRLTRSTLPRNIEVKFKAQPDLWQVEADATQLNQVLTNLTINARDAMPDGGTISFQTSHFVPGDEYLATHVEARPGEFVRVRVQDSGPGIPAELRQRIFEPFFTTKENGKGSGLGLAIVFSIIKQHHGWVACESEVGKGTCFEFFLPRCREPKQIVGMQDNASVAANQGTILLVDDERMIQQLGKTILTQAGFEVLLAEDGRKAIEIYEANHERIALVILDAVMPGLSGREALRILSRRFPKMKVLFSSGYSTEGMSLAEFPQVRNVRTNNFPISCWGRDGSVVETRQDIVEEDSRRFLEALDDLS